MEQTASKELSLKLFDSGVYNVTIEALLTGEINKLWEKLDKLFNTGQFWPGYLARHIESSSELPESIEVKEDKDSVDYNYFQLTKNHPFEDLSPDRKRKFWNVYNFDLKHTSGKTGMMRLNNGDLMGGHIELAQELRRAGEAMADKNVTDYVFSVRVVGCPSRNTALEVLDVFSKIVRDHVEDIQSEFTGPFVKVGQFISDLPNKLLGLQDTIQSVVQFGKTLSAAIDCLNNNNSAWIRHERYNLPGLKMPTYASRVGKGFGYGAKVALARSIMCAVESQMDFVKKSCEGGDQFLAFLTHDKQWDEVRDIVSNYWHEDEFFVNELFNGVNPFSITIANPDDVHDEFQHLQRADGSKIDLKAFARGDLFVSKYPEIRKWVYPNVKDDRRIYCLEPEILSCVLDGKLTPLGIGFYFGEMATNLEVFCPPGITWRGIATPHNLWSLAKNFALTADCQSHQIVKHLGMGHLFSEAFAIAHHNTYNYVPRPFLDKKRNGNPVIGNFLAAHFVDLIPINTLARETLVAPVNNLLKGFFAVNGEIWPTVIGEYYTQQNNVWNQIGFHEELKSRGFDTDFQHPLLYRYLNDGKMLENTIRKYVTQIIETFYDTDDQIKADEKLALFFEQCSDEKNGNIDGFPKEPESRAQVIDVFTRIIWHQSGYHSALNFSQAQSYGYMPLRVSGLRTVLPKLTEFKESLNRFELTPDGQDVSSRYISKCMPTNYQFLDNVFIVQNLTTRTVPTLATLHSPFIHSDRDLKIQAAEFAFKKFKMQLGQIEYILKTTNANSKYPYVHLLPSRVDASLSI